MRVRVDFAPACEVVNNSEPKVSEPESHARVRAMAVACQVWCLLHARMRRKAIANQAGWLRHYYLPKERGRPLLIKTDG